MIPLKKTWVRSMLIFLSLEECGLNFAQAMINFLFYHFCTCSRLCRDVVANNKNSLGLSALHEGKRMFRTPPANIWLSVIQSERRLYTLRDQLKVQFKVSRKIQALGSQ